jgi:hypothetical protein
MIRIGDNYNRDRVLADFGITMIGYTRASGSAVYIESSTLTYSSKSYVSL